MSNFQDNPSVGNPNNKFDGENETPLKWAYEMDKTQFKYRCPCKKGYHAHGNISKNDEKRKDWIPDVPDAFRFFKTQEDSFRPTVYISYHEITFTQSR